MQVRVNISQSLEAIRANLFRAGITIFIIALGITALVVVMTSIEGIKSGMSSSFSSMGTNTFRIQNQASRVVFGGRRGARPKRLPPITYEEATRFQKDFVQFAPVCITGSGSPMNEVKYRQTSTNPNIQMVGTDEYYSQTARYLIEEGRSISREDVDLTRNVVVLGYEIREKLFPYESPVGKFVNVGGDMYKVIGVYEKMGTSGLSGADRTVVVPITTLRSHYSSMGSLTINVYVAQTEQIESYMEEAKGFFRLVRGLRLRDEEDFAIDKSDAFVEQFLQQISIITLAAQVIALITLLGASVALLNVMLVSVTERTMEIGLRKALGATRSNIQAQFLIEAVLICQLGGIVGIFLGVIGGNLVSNLAFAGTFVIPWAWMMIGVVACLLVGVASGFYPAWKASRVDPIDSLRGA